MVVLTRLNGKQLMLNENFFEMVKETPDTVITMTNGNTYIVQENMEEILQKIAAFSRYCRQRTREPGGRES
ncbi:MAG: flagellar FlbD family protein [Bacteroides sp.]|nr:flagellar FlbD family protein [Eubacterium sp.]MCM1419465.1 flagellar FlbD family protein [Roseburia sp.]MCM1463325.1 flagellar FlbD family protein [Bacteroides sp.]